MQVIDTTQTVLTALTLAFIFRAFLVEAFIIPTGSMAPALLGAHATRTCPACGWEFDFAPAGECLCPNCHLRTPLPADEVAHKAGDRILVHKWPFVVGGLFRPQRWQVIVFRNPSDPSENYIKRLVGLPGESVEIVDGDVFIDGRIARKPAAVQRALWFVVFDQNYYPHPAAGAVAEPRWVADGPAGGSEPGWSGLETRLVRYHGPDSEERSIRFDPGDASYYEDVYAYNRGPSLRNTPYVGDMRVVAEITFRAGDGTCCWELTRDGNRFLAETRRDGRVSLTLARHGSAGAVERLGQQTLPPFRYGRPYAIEFGHVDYRAYLSVDSREVVWTTDTHYGPALVAARRAQRLTPVGLRVGAAAVDVELRGLRVDRDVYYTPRELRAGPGRPFALQQDEYFVLGDNSPDSRDSREWMEAGVHLTSNYRAGTVRADQIVGPAAFVYLPGLAPLDSAGRWQLPDLGRVRFVR